MQKQHEENRVEKLRGTWAIGELAEYDAEAKKLVINRQPVHLQPRPRALLEYLIQYRGTVIEFQQLRDADLWTQHDSEQAIRNARDFLKKELNNQPDFPLEIPHSTALRLNAVRSEGAPSAKQGGRVIGVTVAGVILTVVVAGGGLGILSVLKGGDSDRLLTAPVQSSASALSTAAPETSKTNAPAGGYGAISHIRAETFHTPNFSYDWISRVASGNARYIDPTTAAGKAYEEGLNAYAAGDLVRARRRIKDAIVAAPDIPDYKAGVVAVAAASGKWDKARATLKALQSASLRYPKPTRLAAELQLATYAIDVGSPEQSLAEFNGLLKKIDKVFAANSTARAGALYGKGQALAELGRWTKADDTLEDAYAITSDIKLPTSYWYGRKFIPLIGRAAEHVGRCGIWAHRLEDAIELQTITEYKPYTPLETDIAIEAAHCLAQIGQRKGALRYLDRLKRESAERAARGNTEQRTRIQELEQFIAAQ